jgi:hypothetical protein
VLKIASYLQPNLPADEWAELLTMVGEVFEVESIDEYGQPWVSKDWNGADGELNFSHSLALEADEMELVQG